jgi:hypothetical protein
VQNDDGTITLPGGGTYYYDKDKVTVSNGTVIKNDGTIPTAPVNEGKFIQGNFVNSGKIIKIEKSDGNIVLIESDGTININGKRLSNLHDMSICLSGALGGDNLIKNFAVSDDFIGDFKWNDYLINPDDYSDFANYIINFDDYSEFNESLVSHYDWRIFPENWNGYDLWLNMDNKTVTLMIGAMSVITNKDQKPVLNNDGTITLTGDALVTKSNGDSFAIPAGTVIENKEGNFSNLNERDNYGPGVWINWDNRTIISIIGELSVITRETKEPVLNNDGTISLTGDSLITNADSISFALPAGTVIDGDGNIVK